MTTLEQSISLALFPLLVIVMLLLASPVVSAQDGASSPTAAPPPLKLIPKDEKDRLESTDNAKARVRLSIQLAEEHLLQAEQLTAAARYAEASAEIGRYNAIIEEELNVLSALDRSTNKTRDLYKRLELALRAHGPRLATMRRSTPRDFAVRIEEVEEFARKGRTEALNSFYGQTVIRDLPARAGRQPNSQSDQKPERRHP
jgi:hypothetical protein